MKIILGTMTFSDQVDRAATADMISTFKQAGHQELDTAFVYNEGKTESLLGELATTGLLTDCSMASKANPWVDGGLTPASVTAQLTTSLQRTGRVSFELYYLHSPDLNVPIRDTLASIQKHYISGHFKRFGLSNFAAWQVAEIVEICAHEGWIQPTVYQGMYNALTRDVERELMPCLANYGLAFYVYNPLAGGLLSGKHHNANLDAPGEGRFTSFKPYVERYWKPDYHKVVNDFIAAAKAADIPPANAALRWLIHHSAIANSATEHAIILGASSIAHLQQNLQACLEGPLPDTIINTLDTGWEEVKPVCIKYFRP